MPLFAVWRLHWSFLWLFLGKAGWQDSFFFFFFLKCFFSRLFRGFSRFLYGFWLARIFRVSRLEWQFLWFLPLFYFVLWSFAWRSIGYSGCSIVLFLAFPRRLCVHGCLFRWWNAFVLELIEFWITQRPSDCKNTPLDRVFNRWDTQGLSTMSSPSEPHEDQPLVLYWVTFSFEHLDRHCLALGILRQLTPWEVTCWRSQWQAAMWTIHEGGELWVVVGSSKARSAVLGGIFTQSHP